MPNIIMDCKRCTYFKKVKDLARAGCIIVGFCELRQKHITDETIRMELCKDRAIIKINTKEMPKISEAEDDFVKRAAFG